MGEAARRSSLITRSERRSRPRVALALFDREHHAQARARVVVVDDQHRPIGIVTPADLRDRDQYSPVDKRMQREPVTITAGMSNRDAFLLMERQRVKAGPVLDAGGRLCGLLTKDDAVRLELLRPCNNAEGALMVADAVGISSEAASKAGALLEIGVDALVLDMAHGHQRRMLDAVRAVSGVVRGRAPIVAGNVCTAEGTRDLIEAGADVVEVNVGPGAMCTTRMQTGVGRPTFSSVRVCAAEARRLGKHVWADGGVRPREHFVGEPLEPTRAAP